MIKKALLYFFILFYGFAGLMHFIQPDIYLEVIPDWLGNKVLFNYLAGAIEIGVAVLACFKKTRKTASYLTIVILLVFIISHIYFIQLGSCAGAICIPAWISWLRLIIVHPLLIWWAWKIRKW